MVAPTLTDYSYQYKDTGILLNADGASFPFWDVNKIQGITDFPELAWDALDQDGLNGSFITGIYFKNRTIIADGILYSAPADVETNNELLKATILPDGIDYPFYWKHPNKTQRYFLAKPLAYSSDTDTGRRTGTMPFQLQLGCTDPRSYIDIASVGWTTATNYTFTNAGNTATGQIISIVATSTTTANITVSNQTQGRSFQFTVAVTSGQTILIDVEKLIVTVAGVLKPVNMTLTGGAFPTAPTGLNTWRVTSNVGNGNAVTKSAWL